MVSQGQRDAELGTYTHTFFSQVALMVWVKEHLCQLISIVMILEGTLFDGIIVTLKETHTPQKFNNKSQHARAHLKLLLLTSATVDVSCQTNGACYLTCSSSEGRSLPSLMSLFIEINWSTVGCEGLKWRTDSIISTYNLPCF